MDEVIEVIEATLEFKLKNGETIGLRLGLNDDKWAVFTTPESNPITAKSCAAIVHEVRKGIMFAHKPTEGQA